jgi:hypothetical protein
MPLTPKGAKVKKAMSKEYGEKKGAGVFYAMINSGKLAGVEGNRKKK